MNVIFGTSRKKSQSSEEGQPQARFSLEAPKLSDNRNIQKHTAWHVTEVCQKCGKEIREIQRHSESQIDMRAFERI